MKLTIIILTSIFVCTINNFTEETKDRLNSALDTDQVTIEQYSLFNNQIEFRSEINLQNRIDSMKNWGLDILYIEEIYYPKRDSFLVSEYYFSSDKEQHFNKTEKDENWTVYRPEKYFENGKLTSRYFFKHMDSRENLSSIRQHMQTRKLVDKIDATVKKDVIHAGCGYSGRAVEMARGKVEKNYNNPQTPNYYLIESFIKNDSLTVSFQLPEKRKFKVIVEGHSF